MTAEKHVREKERLVQVLHDQEKFDNIVSAITQILKQNNLDGTPGLATDIFIYILEELHLEKFNPLSKI